MRALIDTNIFVYATYPSFAEHRAARDFLRTCRDGRDTYAISWGIIYEYLRVVTHPQLFRDGAIPIERALENVERFCQATECEVLPELPDHLHTLRQVVTQLGRAKGNLLHDCHIVALMQEHDVKRIYTADSDFRLFPPLNVVNPLL